MVLNGFLCADVPLRTYTLTLTVYQARVIHRVSKKLCKFVFCQNFVKFPPILIIFLQKDGKEAKIMRDALILHLT